MILRVATIACFVSASSLHAATVITDDNLSWGPGSITSPFPGVPDANYAATIFQDAAATDPTSAWFHYDLTTIRGINENIDEGSAWYVVSPGDVFSKQSIENGFFDPLISFGPVFHPAVAVGFGQDIYLGVNSGQGFGPDDRNVFGWVLLRPISGVLTMVENVMSYDSPGIVIGTTTLVPEPSTMAMAFCGALILLRRPHRPRGRRPRLWVPETSSANGY